MSTVTFKGFGDAARRLPRILKSEAKIVAQEFLAVTTETTGRKAYDLTKRGPDARHPESRKLKNGWRFDTGGRVEPIKAGFTVKVTDLTTRSVIGNKAPHAVIIDKGLGRSKPSDPVGFRKLPGKVRVKPGTGGTKPTRFTPSKPIGSPLMPRGISRPTVAFLDATQNAIKAKAVARAEAKAPKA